MTRREAGSPPPRAASSFAWVSSRRLLAARLLALVAVALHVGEILRRLGVARVEVGDLLAELLHAEGLVGGALLVVAGRAGGHLGARDDLVLADLGARLGLGI